MKPGASNLVARNCQTKSMNRPAMTSGKSAVARTVREILDDLLLRFPSNINTNPGSNIRMLMEVIAQEIWGLETELDSLKADLDPQKLAEAIWGQSTMAKAGKITKEDIEQGIRERLNAPWRVNK